MFIAVHSLFYVQVFACTVVYCVARFYDSCCGVTYYITCSISFPARVVDCIYYSFNCCNTIFTIYAWFAINAVFHFTDCYIVFNLTICINGSCCVVAVNEVQALRQFHGLSVCTVCRVFQFCIAKVNCFCTYFVDSLAISTCTGCYFYVVPFFNLCFSRFQLSNVNCISVVHTSFYISDKLITSIDTAFSNGWTLVDYQTIISNASTTDS